MMDHFWPTTSKRADGYGGLAQLGERLPCKQEVSGSIPLISTRIEIGLKHLRKLECFNLASKEAGAMHLEN